MRGDDSVPEYGELLRRCEAEGGVGDPSVVEAHDPFHECRRGSRADGFVQDRGRWGGSGGDAFPSGDGCGVASPPSKKSSINANVASGDGWRCRVARSITWWLSAIVPRRALTCSRLSPPRDESEASGVRNRAVGEDEDAEAVVRSADQGSR